MTGIGLGKPNVPIPKIILTLLLRHVQSEAGNGSVHLTHYPEVGRLLSQSYRYERNLRPFNTVSTTGRPLSAYGCTHLDIAEHRQRPLD
jgi:hypothetical protein